MDPVILASARKHGITDDDMLHAALLEVGVAVAEGIEFIVHAMPARPKYLR